MMKSHLFLIPYNREGQEDHNTINNFPNPLQHKQNISSIVHTTTFSLFPFHYNIKCYGIYNSLVKDLFLFLILGGGETHLSLSLVVHHLLHKSAGISLQVCQLKYKSRNIFIIPAIITFPETPPPKIPSLKTSTDHLVEDIYKHLYEHFLIKVPY